MQMRIEMDKVLLLSESYICRDWHSHLCVTGVMTSACRSPPLPTDIPPTPLPPLRDTRPDPISGTANIPAPAASLRAQPASPEAVERRPATPRGGYDDAAADASPSPGKDGGVDLDESDPSFASGPPSLR